VSVQLSIVMLFYCVLSGYDGFGEVMRPSHSVAHGGSSAGLMNQMSAQPDKLIQSDLDGSLALLAGNLSIRPEGQMRKYVISCVMKSFGKKQKPETLTFTVAII